MEALDRLLGPLQLRRRQPSKLLRLLLGMGTVLALAESYNGAVSAAIRRARRCEPPPYAAWHPLTQLARSLSRSVQHLSTMSLRLCRHQSPSSTAQHSPASHQPLAHVLSLLNGAH